MGMMCRMGGDYLFFTENRINFTFIILPILLILFYL